MKIAKKIPFESVLTLILLEDISSTPFLFDIKQLCYMMMSVFCKCACCMQVWISISVATFLIGLLLFVLSRVSPYSRYSTSGSNEFNFRNAMWFALASLMQQGRETFRSLLLFNCSLKTGGIKGS